jgi:hypothetical protein
MPPSGSGTSPCGSPSCCSCKASDRERHGRYTKPGGSDGWGVGEGSVKAALEAAVRLGRYQLCRL